MLVFFNNSIIGKSPSTKVPMQLLTQSIIDRDKPHFSFLVRVDPYHSYKNNRVIDQDPPPYCFLKLGGHLILPFSPLFAARNGFEPYGITDFKGAALDELGNRIEVWALLLRAMTEEQFLGTYGNAIIRTLGIFSAKEELLPTWTIYRDDLVKLLHHAKKHCRQALCSNKVVSIIGI